MLPSTNRTPVLVTGCQRSGTTLMNLILNSHPGIMSIDEDNFAFPAVYNYLCAPQGPPFMAFKLPRFAHLLPFIKMLPGCRVLWCIRDPLDTVWSMNNLMLTDANINAPWAIHPHGGWFEVSNSFWVLNDAQKNGLREPAAQVAVLTQKLARLANTPDWVGHTDRRDSVFVGALCWAIKNELPRLYADNGIGFHAVRYADLVTDPRATISRILDYIGLEWDDRVLSHHRLHEGTSIGETSNTRPIDRASLGGGRANLSAEERDVVRSVCAATAGRWDYPLD